MRFTRLFLGAALACAGCDNDDQVLIDPVAVAVNDGQIRGAVLADTANVELGGADYTVVLGKTASIAAAINSGEIAQDAFASEVVVRGEITQYANVALAEHATSNVALDGLVRELGVGFIPSTTETNVASGFALGLENLHATPPLQVDFAYTELQVMNHASNLVLLQQLRAMLADDAMGAFIDDMRAMESDHLDAASDLYISFF